MFFDRSGGFYMFQTCFQRVLHVWNMFPTCSTCLGRVSNVFDMFLNDQRQLSGIDFSDVVAYRKGLPSTEFTGIREFPNVPNMFPTCFTCLKHVPNVFYVSRTCFQHV